MKFCVDCKHLEIWEGRFADETHMCTAKLTKSVDLVTGKQIDNNWNTCYPCRKDAALCGPEGVWWEAK